jgi:hypothetical protein
MKHLALALLVLSLSAQAAEDSTFKARLQQAAQIAPSPLLDCLLKHPDSRALDPQILSFGEPRLGDLQLQKQTDGSWEITAVRPRSTAAIAKIEVGDVLLNPSPAHPCNPHYTNPLPNTTPRELKLRTTTGASRTVWIGDAKVIALPMVERTHRTDDKSRDYPILRLTELEAPAFLDELKTTLTLTKQAHGLIIDLREAQAYRLDTALPVATVLSSTERPLALIVSPWTHGAVWAMIERLQIDSKALIIGHTDATQQQRCSHYTLTPLNDTTLYRCAAPFKQPDTNDWIKPNFNAYSKRFDAIHEAAIAALRKLNR